MNRIIIFKLTLIAVLSVLLFSCKTSQQLAYFQDLTDTAKVQLVELYPYRPLRLQINDEVQIIVTSSSPEASSFFNITSISSSSSAVTLNSYSVTPNGTIILPVLGEMKVVGLTTQELKQKVGESLQPYLKDAVVSVRILNFKVTVIGEVLRPITVPVNGERFNVLEAIGAAGDMTIYSKRYNVKVMRTSPEGMSVATLNFNYSRLMQSPFFQLQQNDVVYVEPEKSKGIAAERATILLPVVVTVTSLILTLVTILTR